MTTKNRKSKIAIQFRKSRYSAHTFQLLLQCKNCSTYSSLWGDRCLKCGKESSFLNVVEVAKVISKQSIRSEYMIIAGLCSLALFFAGNLAEILLSTGVCIALLGFYRSLHNKYASFDENHRLLRLLLKGKTEMLEGFQLDINEAVADIKEDDYKSAYEKLREVSRFLTDERVKLRKIVCLNHFILRKDMDLELSTLVPVKFDKDFARYLLEVGKVNPRLIKKDVFEYVLLHRGEFDSLPEGKQILINVAGAALRMKVYLKQYHGLVLEFLDELPRDRLLRLCKLIAEEPDHYPELTKRTRGVVKLKYDFDPEFQGIV
jgi:hypothetical protein